MQQWQHLQVPALQLTCDGPAECKPQSLGTAKVADATLTLLLAEQVAVAGMVLLQRVVVEQVAPCGLCCVLVTWCTSVLQASTEADRRVQTAGDDVRCFHVSGIA